MTQLTAEQITIINWPEQGTSQHLVAEARAGAGKTFVLIKLIPKLKGSVSIQAFNKAIAVELAQRMDRDLSFADKIRANASTVHAHGLRAWPRDKKPRVEGGKCRFILKDMFKTEGVEFGEPLAECGSAIANLISLAKSAGFGLTSSGENFPSIQSDADWRATAEHHSTFDDLRVERTPELEQAIISYARRVLLMSNNQLNMIDFDDMIYLPLLHNMQLDQYDNILLDEAQDINATRREMAFRSLRPNGRLIAVGDRYQAIYGFTGASDTSLDDIQRRAAADILPLTTCWRCDGAIIAKAQEIVPDIKCKPGAEEKGLVRTIGFESLPATASAEPVAGLLDLAQPGDAILCRLNKPNVATALGLLRRGKPARIEGRDIGKRLIFHVQRATDRYAFQTLDETLIDLDTYKSEQIRMLLGKKKEAAADMLDDEVECAKLLVERCIEDRKTDYSAFEQMVQSLFADDVPARSFITLSSVHKSKGREWPRVFILGRYDYMPFWRAVETGGWQLEQEHNLIYVAITRAEHELYFVTGVKSALDRGVHREAPKHQASRKALTFSGLIGEAAQDAIDRDLNHALQRHLDIDLDYSNIKL